MSGFEALGLSKEVLAAIEELGYESPSPIQEQRSPAAGGARRDRPGADRHRQDGCFRPPIIQYIDPSVEEVQALVLTPTRELCIQVTQAIRAYGASSGVDVVAVFGGAPIRNQEAQLRAVDTSSSAPSGASRPRLTGIFGAPRLSLRRPR